MIEHTEQDPLYNSTNIQPKNPTEEIIPSITPEPITQKNEAENMEVHHHTHHEGKKNWKTYFWEFLMLFLAVFCSFLAEYQLEHLFEHNREKEFIQSFIEDLKTDTAAINKNLAFHVKKREQLDSMIYLLREQKIKGHENELYFLARNLIRTTRFQSNDRTITQLKYSGSMRLIRNENAADSIISNQKLVDYIHQNQEDDRLERRSLDPLLSRMFNSFIFDNMLDESNNIIRPLNNPLLRSYDPDLQSDLAYELNQLKGSSIIIKIRLTSLNIMAKNTIQFLKKEYNLD